MTVPIRKYTDWMVSNEVNGLICLHGMLVDDQITTREEFSNLVSAAFEHGQMNPRELADDLGFSASTVYRWVEGVSAPHPSLWPTVVTWILEGINRRISTLQDSNVIDLDAVRERHLHAV